MVICDRGVEDDAMLGTENFDFAGRVSCREKRAKTGTYLHLLELISDNGMQ